MAKAKTSIDPKVAARHEALYPRLLALLSQAEAGAVKRGDTPLDAVTQRLAEDLLFEARPFIDAPRAMPPAAPNLAGLATQLGQAVAAMDAYEAARSAWDPDVGALVWRVQGTTPLPIARLRPKAEAPTHPDLVEIIAIQRRQVLAMHERFEAEQAKAWPESAAASRE